MGIRASLTLRGWAATRESRPEIGVGARSVTARDGPEDAVASLGRSRVSSRPDVIRARAASLASRPGINCVRAGPQVPMIFFLFAYLYT